MTGEQGGINKVVGQECAADFTSAKEAIDDDGSFSLRSIGVAKREGGLPTSFGQQRLWFLAQLDERAGKAYHGSVALRLRGVLDREALRAALDRIVERHESLRTRFVMVDGIPAQHIDAAGGGFALLEHPLHRKAEVEEELGKLIEEEANTAFDLAAGPLVRGRLIRVSAEEHVLLITMHHIVTDAWSMIVLLRELRTLYEAYREGKSDPLPLLAIQYADYAVWQRKRLQGERLQQQTEYWQRALGDAPQLLSVPTDHERPAVQDYVGDMLRVELDERLTNGLKALSRRHRTTLFITVLAGWAALLSRLAGQEEVVIGTPVANRVRTELEGLIGFFANTLPIRVDVSGIPTVTALLGRVRERVHDALKNQDIPFERWWSC